MITRSKNNVVYVDNVQDEMNVLAEIVEKKQFAMIKQRGEKKGLLVDLYSASVIMQVYKALSPENKKKLESLPLAARADLCFSVISR